MADKKKYSTQLRRVPARPRSERLRRNGLGDVETRRRRERRSDEEIEKLRNRLEWREDISMKTWDRIDSLVVASRYVLTASDAAVKAGDTLYAKVWRETALGVTREAVSYGRVTCPILIIPIIPIALILPSAPSASPSSLTGSPR